MRPAASELPLGGSSACGRSPRLILGIKQHATSGNYGLARLLKNVVYETVGAENTGGIAFSLVHTKLWEQLFSREEYVEDFPRRERIWVPVLATD